MDPKLYKHFKTSRGFKYNYYYRPSTNSDKPTLLLLHGFPSTSADWARVVSFFSNEGYGLLVPDLLGYGSTDKPTDPDAYRLKKMASDIVELLDTEKLASSDNAVVSISHDWGSGLNSRLAIYFPGRFRAFAFFAMSYTPSSVNFDLGALNAASMQKFGYEKFGYWEFFVRDGADKKIEDHLDSFFTLLFSREAKFGVEHWCPVGGLEKWLLEDRKSDKVVVSDEEKQYYIDAFSKGGFAGPLCWYKAMVLKLNAVDDAEIPKSAYIVTKPVFFGGCTHDAACVASDGAAIVHALCPNSTVKDFESGHWVLNERPAEVNEELKKWLEGLQLVDQAAASKY